MDYLLKTATEDEMEEALIAAGVAVEHTDEDGEVTVAALSGVTIDMIGPIPPEYAPDGTETKPGVPGWHANLRVTYALDPAVEQALPVLTEMPTTPYRVFF